MDPKPDGYIRSLDKAMDILEVLSAENRALSLAEISRRLGFKSSSAHHLVATLRRRGFVDQDPQTKAYRLGGKLIGFVNGYLANADISALAIETLRELRDASGDTSYLTILHGLEMISVIELVGHRPIQCRRPSRPGQPHLHSTASGKVLLAYLPPERAAALLATMPLTRFTSHTITDPDALRAELATIHQHGYALDREENIEGVACVAAPVFGRDGACLATASVAFPAAQMARREELVPLVVETAAKISANLGQAPAERVADKPEHAVA